MDHERRVLRVVSDGVSRTTQFWVGDVELIGVKSVSFDIDAGDNTGSLHLEIDATLAEVVNLGRLVMGAEQSG